MRFNLALLLATSLLVPAHATLGARRPAKSTRYTIQIGSFSMQAQAQQLIARLGNRGEFARLTVVDVPGRGSWTRVSVGFFATVKEARERAEAMVSRGVISEFFIRTFQDSSEHPAPIDQTPGAAALRPSPATFGSGLQPSRLSGGPSRAPVAVAEASRPRVASSLRSSPTRADQRLVASLPIARRLSLALSPTIETRFLPRPDPARLAFSLITGDARHSRAPREAGLWVTGDTAEGLARLRWIAGPDAAELITLEGDGQVKMDTRLLARAARVEDVPLIERPLAATDYICSNEGLLLLVQLTQSRHRYRLHIGRQAPTRGAAIAVAGGINLDNNFDSRINPHRRLGKKMDNERPPDGFDSLVAINPVARWFNQQTNQLVPAGLITFHEMAEAHAKLELGLEYLSDGSRIGAHDVALDREKRLKAQRPLAGVVLTAGANRVLRSEEEVREFFSRSASAGRQR